MKTFANQQLEFKIGEELYEVPELSVTDEFEWDEYIHDIVKNSDFGDNETEFEFLKRALGKNGVIEFAKFGQRLVPMLQDQSLMSCASIFLKITYLFFMKRVDLKKKS